MIHLDTIKNFLKKKETCKLYKQNDNINRTDAPLEHLSFPQELSFALKRSAGASLFPSRALFCPQTLRWSISFSLKRSAEHLSPLSQQFKTAYAEKTPLCNNINFLLSPLSCFCSN